MVGFAPMDEEPVSSPFWQFVERGVDDAWAEIADDWSHTLARAAAGEVSNRELRAMVTHLWGRAVLWSVENRQEMWGVLEQSNREDEEEQTGEDD